MAPTFLVMEYLAGEGLQDRLKKGTLPLDQALEGLTLVRFADAVT